MTYRLTMSQRNIYWSGLNGADFSVNTLHTTLHFLEKMDEARLTAAVNDVISNNDVFKLKIHNRGEEIFQDFCGEINGCAIDNAIYTEEELSAIFIQRKRYIFDMDKPLYDFTLYRKQDGFYVLSIITHHIITDGYGVGVLCSEILRQYQRLLVGQAPSLETLPFAASLQTPEPESEENKAFWRTYFEGYPLGGKPFPIKTGFTTAAVLKRTMDNQAILDFCGKHSLTPYTVFTAALGIYLMRIYGTDETSVIIPRMNRELSERKTIGCFVLPVPVRIKKTENFVDLCRQIRREGRRVSCHKKYDFSQIIENFKKEFSSERAVSEFTLNFQLKDVQSDLKTKMDFSACGAMHNLLTLNISNYEGGSFYDITYDYRSDLLNEQYADYFHNALVWIIAQGLEETPVSEITIVPPEELSYLKTAMKGESIPYDGNETIVSLFKKAAAALPHAPAVFTRDRETPLSFSELDRRSDAVAISLVRKGVRKGSLIAFLLKRDATLLPVMLGILKAGCGFLPLDINYPKGRIDYILSDSKAVFVIATAKTAEKFGIEYMDAHGLLRGETNEFPDITINQNDLAYCIYTSGTTGQPKGVLLAHKGIVNIINPQNNPFNKAVCAIGTGIVAIGSVCFDISLFELLVFLLNGKFAAIASDDELANGEAIAELFQKTGANALHCTPSRLQSYLTGTLFAEVMKKQVKILLSAGETLPVNLALAIIQYEINIYNGYGPTETTIGATITEANDYKTIGRPIANATVYIVDANKQLMPFGVTGEIAITGDGVAIGYNGKEKLTAEKFTFINDERGYLTGDLGYFLPDGRLVYVARNDSQIKIRGYRIEISEIEQCALQYHGVDNGAVIIKDINDERYLILYYSGSERDGQVIKAHLSEFLSYYMVPQMVVWMPSLPTNINGKIDRSALLELHVSMERQYTPPSTKEEQIFCEAFASALSLKQVGIDDNFFEIGGSSLSAIKMMLHAHKYDLDVAYPSIFRYPTPRLLAENMRRREVKIQNYLLPLVSEHEKELEEIDGYLRQKPDGHLTGIPLGNVLVTGATGFLGSHVVKYLLEDQTVGKIYCLVQPKGKLTPKKRLKTTLYYYAIDIADERFTEKIIVIDGNITDKNIFTHMIDDITTVVNCAANVAHFAYGDALKSVNIDAVKNLIDFCTAKNASLIHISTISVAGHRLKEKIAGEPHTENDFYKGQIISNEYIYSKFVAEYLILQAKMNGLKAKIMRVGNLQGRAEDGEFQINLRKNAFARNIQAYTAIGKAPASLKYDSVNISPVDETAKALLLLAALPDCFTVFHVINPLTVPYDKIFSELSTIKKEISYIADEDFETLIGQLVRDGTQSKDVEGLLFEKNDIRLQEVAVAANMTVGLLENQGFRFKPIEEDYIQKYLNQLNGLGFFD